MVLRTEGTDVSKSLSVLTRSGAVVNVIVLGQWSSICSHFCSDMYPSEDILVLKLLHRNIGVMWNFF